MLVDTMRVAVALVPRRPVALGTMRPTDLAYLVSAMDRRQHRHDTPSQSSSLTIRSTRSAITSTMARLEENSGAARCDRT